MFESRTHNGEKMMKAQTFSGIRLLGVLLALCLIATFATVTVSAVIETPLIPLKPDSQETTQPVGSETETRQEEKAPETVEVNQTDETETGAGEPIAENKQGCKSSLSSTLEMIALLAVLGAIAVIKTSKIPKNNHAN